MENVLEQKMSGIVLRIVLPYLQLRPLPTISMRQHLCIRADPTVAITFVIKGRIHKIVPWIAGLPSVETVYVRERKIPKLVQKTADQHVETTYAKKVKLPKVVLGIVATVGTGRVRLKKQIHALRIVRQPAEMEYVKWVKAILVAPMIVRVPRKILHLYFTCNKRTAGFFD
ncbi:MAG: hypothetical protein ACHQT7_02685 [Candidatus Levyibacteriota bacterium]